MPLIQLEDCRVVPAAVRKPCRFFPRGRCRNGRTCAFSHEDVGRSCKMAPAGAREPDDRRQNIPCIDYFTRGVCPFEGKCKFAHDADTVRQPRKPKEPTKGHQRKLAQNLPAEMSDHPMKTQQGMQVPVHKNATAAKAVHSRSMIPAWHVDARCSTVFALSPVPVAGGDHRPFHAQVGKPMRKLDRGDCSTGESSPTYSSASVGDGGDSFGGSCAYPNSNGSDKCNSSDCIADRAGFCFSNRDDVAEDEEEALIPSAVVVLRTFVTVVPSVFASRPRRPLSVPARR
mmetsp:Transcript_31485/g.92164  ORF Transcript_31485/g.92164 Transcript_31485/m.92164 type:complete len:286 (+) Transcript_31485:3-860(+)